MGMGIGWAIDGQGHKNDLKLVYEEYEYNHRVQHLLISTDRICRHKVQKRNICRQLFVDKSAYLGIGV